MHQKSGLTVATGSVDWQAILNPGGSLVQVQVGRLAGARAQPTENWPKGEKEWRWMQA